MKTKVDHLVEHQSFVGREEEQVVKRNCGTRMITLSLKCNTDRKEEYSGFQALFPFFNVQLLFCQYITKCNMGYWKKS